MKLRLTCCLAALFALALLASNLPSGEKGDTITVDPAKKTITIPCKVAPRKVLQDTIYPLEVVATFPHPRGQKAHETVVVFNVKPSEVHKALEKLGLKAGKPARGQIGTATGPEVAIFIELEGGKQVPIEETMVDLNSGKTLPKQKWLFTGSAMKMPDPEKDDVVYGADLSGTLITIFPVTDDTVFQTTLKASEEKGWKLETNPKVLPKEGTPVKLIIQAK